MQLSSWLYAMGCGSSTSGPRLEAPRKKSILPEQIPKISTTGLENVSFLPFPAVKVMFIFGGPGSGKGRIVAKLCERFNIRLLSAESLILKHLPRKVKRVLNISTIREMSDVVRSDPSLISLDWVLKLLQQAITESCDDRDVIYLVDVIPNLKWLVRNEYLVRNCSKEMEAFEEKVKISFAMNLQVQESMLESTLDYSHHTSLASGSGTMASVSDEVDSSRAKHRYKINEQATAPFIKYFKCSKRLISIDITSDNVGSVSDAVYDIFTSLHVTPCRYEDTVLVFTLGDMVVGDLDLANCDMKVIAVKNIVPNPFASLEDLLDLLCKYIMQDHGRYYVVDSSETTLMSCTAHKFHRRAIIFSDDIRVGHCVDKITVALNTLTGLSYHYFKSISSSNNETIIFPYFVNDSFCHQVALFISNYN